METEKNGTDSFSFAWQLSGFSLSFEEDSWDVKEGGLAVNR